MTGYILLGVVVLLLVGAVTIYNRLVTNKNMVAEGWSGIDVQLKRRNDLIPNLIEAVKGYMGHERGVLEQVTELRTKSQAAQGVGEKAKAEGAMGAALANLFAVAENYPDLRPARILWTCKNPWPTSRTRSSWPGAITTALPGTSTS